MMSRRIWQLWMYSVKNTSIRYVIRYLLTLATTKNLLRDWYLQLPTETAHHLRMNKIKRNMNEMGKWNKYKFAMFVIALFSTWIAVGMSIDYGTSFFDGFCITFGLLSFCVLGFVILLDLLEIPWGAV